MEGVACRMHGIPSGVHPVDCSNAELLQLASQPPAARLLIPAMATCVCELSTALLSDVQVLFSVSGSGLVPGV